MRVFPVDILSGILLVLGFIQLIYGYMIRRNTSRTKFITIFLMGFLLISLSMVYFISSLNSYDDLTGSIILFWIIWALVETALIIVWRCRSR